MKRTALIRHPRRHGCQLVREGRAHGRRQTVPRHTEIKNQLAHRICRMLELPAIGG